MTFQRLLAQGVLCVCYSQAIYWHDCIYPLLSPCNTPGCFRYRVSVEIPVQRTLYRVLPPSLQEGKEIDVVVVLFTQGINEQQSLADR